MQNARRRYLRRLRYAVQWGVFALVLQGGVQFYFFAGHFTRGGAPVERPPLVDGFLPIGALMSLRLWVQKGVFDPVHPAALVIFLAALATSALMKKSFCGWVCPVGALSEQAYRLGGRLFGRNFRLPGYLDYSLRLVKYLLLGFFLYAVLVKTPLEGIVQFVHTPYWKVADVKMLHFFTEMTAFTGAVLGGLVALSLFYRNFWCRYLCPYGALTGLLSCLSPAKVSRNEEACSRCGLCSKTCPSHLPVDRKRRVRSPECSGCLTCVSVCPARDALDAALPRRRTVTPLLYAGLVLALFFGIVGAAKLTGHWQSTVTYREYQVLVPLADRFGHP
jgi:polyferredoxin